MTGIIIALSVPLLAAGAALGFFAKVVIDDVRGRDARHTRDMTRVDLLEARMREFEKLMPMTKMIPPIIPPPIR